MPNEPQREKYALIRERPLPLLPFKKLMQMSRRLTSLAYVIPSKGTTWL